MTENRVGGKLVSCASRRKELEQWRQKTGRTPMKRLSYLRPCATPRPVTPMVIKPTTPSVYSYSTRHDRRTDTRRKENMATTGKKPTKRSVLKQCQSVLTPLNKGVTLIEESHVFTQTTKERRRQDSAQRALMKEMFQRDIDDTVAEILAEKVGHEDSGDIARELAQEFDDAHDEVYRSAHQDVAVNKKPRRRHSSAFFVNSELAFESSKICYTMVASERRGRSRKGRSKHRHTCCGTPDKKTLLYLTPVKRSTRRSCSICPKLATPIGGACYDSPSQAKGLDGYKEVMVVPNQALVFLEEQTAR